MKPVSEDNPELQRQKLFELLIPVLNKQGTGIIHNHIVMGKATLFNGQIAVSLDSSVKFKNGASYCVFAQIIGSTASIGIYNITGNSFVIKCSDITSGSLVHYLAIGE